jgi:hypothetical protein
MNNTTLAHIGSELLVVGGLAFYFHRKTSGLQDAVLQLQKENRDLIEVINEIQEDMQQLATIVTQQQRQLSGTRPAGPAGPSQMKPVPRKPALRDQRAQPVQSQPAAQLETVAPQGGTVPPRTVAAPSSQQSKPSPTEDTDESGLETLDENELDKELSGEYEKLAKERQCNNGVCEL